MADMEKITINLTPVDLGRIDILVEEGFFQNRSDLIRAAIRKELDAHEDTLAAKAERHKDHRWVVGVLHLARRELEEMATSTTKQHLSGIGRLSIAQDVPASLVDWVFSQVHWYGTINASAPVKAVIRRKHG